MSDAEKWDGYLYGACFCCGCDVRFQPNADGLCGEGDEGVCNGCLRVYSFCVDGSTGDYGEPDGGYIRDIDRGDPRPECSCPDSEFRR